MKQTSKKKKSLSECIDKFSYYIMLFPGFILIFIFGYIPIAGIILAFKNYSAPKGILGSKWCGLDNFRAFFRTPDMWAITRNTICYNLVFIFTGILFAVVLALLFNELRKGTMNKVYQTIGMMPYFLSYVIVAYLVYSFLGSTYGVMNKTVLPFLGMDPINWYAESKYWPIILFVVKNWKGIGYSSVVYLAAIAGINQEFYEAARIDGANRFQQAFYITIPCLKTIISIQLIMSMGGLFGGDFGLFYLVSMNQGPLFSTTNVLPTYIYRSMDKVGFATAAGLYASLIGFILVLISNSIVKKLEPENSLF